MTKRSQQSLAKKRGQNPQAHAHYQVVEVAKGLAGALYERVMQSDNSDYSDWKELNPDCNAKELELRFITLFYPKLLGEARATMAKMLATPISETLKDQIVEALILDKSLMRGRAAMPTLLGDTSYVH